MIKSLTQTDIQRYNISVDETFIEIDAWTASQYFFL